MSHRTGVISLFFQLLVKAWQETGFSFHYSFLLVTSYNWCSHLQKSTCREIESQNRLDWRRLLRSSSPTTNLTLSSPKLSHVPKCCVHNYEVDDLLVASIYQLLPGGVCRIPCAQMSLLSSHVSPQRPPRSCPLLHQNLLVHIWNHQLYILSHSSLISQAIGFCFFIPLGLFLHLLPRVVSLHIKLNTYQRWWYRTIGIEVQISHPSFDLFKM